MGLSHRHLSHGHAIICRWRVVFTLLMCGLALMVKPPAWAAPVPNLPNQTVSPFDFQVALPLLSKRPLPIRVTDNFEYVHSPTWSPDSSRIAFWAHREVTFPQTPAGLYTANFDGSDLIRLDFHPPEALENSAGWTATHLDWSPKGDKIAMAFYDCPRCESAHCACYFRTYVVDSDGENFTCINTRATAPHWSPDGSKIAYTYQGSYSQSIDFYVMDADGGNSVYLDSFVYGYTWSPDSRQIAFTSDYSPQLTIVNVDGSDRRVLTEDAGSVNGPVWSPDGRQIVYLSIILGYGELRVMDPADRNPIPLTHAEWDYIGLVTWLPDSERLLFWGRETPSAVSAFYLVDRDGSDLTRVLPFEFFPGTSAVAWSPDATKLLIVGYDDIYVLHVPHE